MNVISVSRSSIYRSNRFSREIAMGTHRAWAMCMYAMCILSSGFVWGAPAADLRVQAQTEAMPSVPPLPPLPAGMMSGVSSALAAPGSAQGNSDSTSKSGIPKDFSLRVRKARADEALSSETLQKFLAAIDRNDIEEAGKVIDSMKSLEAVDSIDYWKLLAIYEAQRGDLKSASVLLREVLDIAPDDDNARRNLVRVEAAMKLKEASDSP